MEEDVVGPTSQCNDKLRSKLYNDDTEKLRRKLAYLQREYLKTHQRLKRSERSEAVKKHVRSRIAEQRSQVDPEDTSTTQCPHGEPSSASLRRGSPASEAPGLPQDQRHTEGQVEEDGGGRKSSVVRFLLPLEAAPPLTPASSQDDQARDQRLTAAPSSALRLRSRRSRLRWQQRWSESAEGEEGQETVRKPEEKSVAQQSVGTQGVAVETQEVKEQRLSGSESESSSLLLTHWNAERHTEVQGGKETELVGDDRDSESPSLLLPHWTPAPPAGRGTHEDILNHKGKEAEQKEERGGEQPRCDGQTNSGHNSDRNKKGKANEKSNDAVNGPQVDQNQERCDKEVRRCDGEGSLRASFTLVEGLLFPPEYYIRTTRRMTCSQQQPDMQAALFSNLMIGSSRRRGRGRGQGTLQDTDHGNLTRAYSDMPAQMVSSGSWHEVQCSSEKALDRSLDNRHDESLVFGAPRGRPLRGGKRKRGRPRGRGFGKGSFCLDVSRMDQEQTSNHSVPAMIPSFPSQSFSAASVLEQGLVSGHTPAVLSHPSSSEFALTPVVPPSAQNDKLTSASVSGSLEQVYPVFRRSGSVTERPLQDVCWRPLLLPSPLAPSDPLLHPSPLALSSALKPLVAMDFHLPDEQFGSLKLHKLRQVIAATAEPFSPPSYHTRRSSQQAYDLFKGNCDKALALSFPFSPTPTLSTSTLSRADGLQSVNLPCPSSVTPMIPAGEREHIDTKVLLGLSPVAPVEDSKLDQGDQLPEGGGQLAKCLEQVSLREAGSLVGRSTRECMDQSMEQEAFAGTPLQGPAEHSLLVESSAVLTEQRGNGGGVVKLSEHHRATNHQREDFNDCEFPAEEAVKSPFKCNPINTTNCQSAIHSCKDPVVQEDHLSSKLTNHSLTEPPTMYSPSDRFLRGPPLRPGASSQLLLSPALGSPPFPLLDPCLPPSTLPSNLPLPSLGLTPRSALASCMPLTSSPCAPYLTLPSPGSLSTLALSPPRLSPCTFLVSPHPATPAPAPTSRQTPTLLDPPVDVGGQSQGVVPSPSPSDVEAAVPADSKPPSTACASNFGETEGPEECAVSFTHTLTAPAGGGLVDACCVSGPSGGLCVAAAGKWAVCLWDQTSASSWGLIHTWTFNKPVISVFSVPDATGLLCVTLGQLEIREVRVMSCCSLVEALLCQGVVQAAVGVAQSRVVCSSHSAAISTLQLFTLTKDGSVPTPRSLASSGTSVGALATVDGLSDALLGSAEGGHLFLWNLRTGQLLQKILLDEGLTHTSCLRGYSYSGVLFVLLQHQYLGSITREGSYHQGDQGHLVSMEKEKEKTTLFSLVAINAVSGKSIVADRLRQPEAWRGRLCEADVLGSRLVGLSQSGSVYVWDLGGPGGPRVVWAAEADGWHVARWGGSNVLVTGHQNGDLTLHRYDQTF